MPADDLAVAQAPPRQLPPDVAGFVGRQAETARLTGQLTNVAQAALVVCLHGGGGSGKTALAVHLAHLIRAGYPDGQLYVQLGGSAGPAADPADVLAAFLRAFALDPHTIPAGRAERAELFRRHVATRKVLVVLDDAAGAQQVAPLLPTTAGSAAIVTSRPVLAVDRACHTQLDTMDDDEALTLLAEYVGRRHVEAEPAAARRIVDERRRLDVLRAGDLAVRGVLLLAWNRLDGDQRTVLQRLSLLPAGRYPCWVAGALLDSAEHTGREVLAGLADANLVERAGDDQDGQPTYAVHDLVRLVARERVDAEETEAARHAAVLRVLDGWLGLAEAADAQLPVSTPFDAGLATAGVPPVLALRGVRHDALGWFDRWHPALALAADLATEYDPNLAIRTSGFHRLRHYEDVRVPMLESVRDLPGVADDLRARALIHLSSAYVQQGVPADRFSGNAEQALELARASGGEVVGAGETQRRRREAAGRMELSRGHHAAALADAYRSAGNNRREGDG